MRYAISPSAAWRSVDGHLFVITADSRQHELVGEVESHLWTQVESRPCTRAELLASLLETFAVGEQRAASDLDNFLAELVEAAILVTKS